MTQDVTIPVDNGEMMSAGEYVVVFFYHRLDKYDEKAVSQSFIVSEVNNNQSTLEVTNQTDSEITFNSTIADQAWIGIYTKGDSNDWENVKAWDWATNESTTINISELANGTYEVRLFYNNSYDVEATVEFTVGGNIQEGYVVNNFDKNHLDLEYPHALKNPLKGFNGWGSDKKGYATLKKIYIPWKEIQYNLSDTNNTIAENLINYIDNISVQYNVTTVHFDKEDVNQLTPMYNKYSIENNFREQNIKLAPIVFGSADAIEHDNFWPDGFNMDYGDESFKIQVRKLIQAIKLAFDKNPKIAYMEMGIVGSYGEFTNPNPQNSGLAQLLKQEYGFFSKQVLATAGDGDFSMVSGSDNDFGAHWDSFANGIKSEDGWRSAIPSRGNLWKKKMFVGEVAYDYGQLDSQLYLKYKCTNDANGCNVTGSDVEYMRDSTLKELYNDNGQKYYDYLIARIREYHTTSLSWLSNYTKSSETITGADEVQKALGYRFILKSVEYKPNVSKGETIHLSYTIKNEGSAPFYYDWPLEISLLDSDTHDVVANLGVDYENSVLYASHWPNDTDESAQTYTIDATIPDNINDGKYILAFSILDPASGSPAVRFANKNYIRGGQHPVGKIGVNHHIDSYGLDGITFYKNLNHDDIKSYIYPFGIDSSLSY